MKIEIGEDLTAADMEAAKDPEWVAASMDHERAETEHASDIETARLRQRLFRVSDDLVARVRARLRAVTEPIARRVRAARSARSTRRAKAKAPTSDDGPVQAIIGPTLRFADDVRPFLDALVDIVVEDVFQRLTQPRTT